MPAQALPHNSSSLVLVTGPSRSGKSEWAEALARQRGEPVVYVATAQRSPNDREWQTRLAAHRRRRPAHWRTLEVPIHLTEAISTPGQAGDCWLVDSLGTWLANCLDQSEAEWQQTQNQFLQALQARRRPMIVVAEETGWGVVPAYPTGRQFRDRLGTLTRAVGAIADQVYLAVAGYAIDLKAQGSPIPPSPPSPSGEVPFQATQD
jgi:adenosylcobinamide kinase/adenosylcobinamide-phosphate guanylyltransferase